MSSNNQKRLSKKMAGILGVASISSLIGLPVFAMTPNAPVLSKTSSNQTLLAQENNQESPTTSTQECFVTPARNGERPEYCSQVVPAYENEENNGQSNEQMNRQTENMPSDSEMNEESNNIPQRSQMNRQSYNMTDSQRINRTERQSATMSIEECFVTPTRDNSFPEVCSQVVPAYEDEISVSDNSMNRQVRNYEQDSQMNRMSENPGNDADMNQETDNTLEENNNTPEVEKIIEDRSRVPGSPNTSESPSNSENMNSNSENMNRSSAVSESDRMFMMEAARSGMTEVQLGQMAVQKASNEAVREFGQRMIDHHTQANSELMQLAAEKGVTLSSDIGNDSREMMSQLSQLSGAEFDRAYMDEMLKAHNKDVSMFQRQAQQGQDPDLKSWASQTLPTLQNHLAMVRNRVEANRYMNR